MGNHIGEYHAVKGAIIGMIWMENLSRDELRLAVRQYIEDQFKETYDFVNENGTIIFFLPDGYRMKVLSFGGDWNSLVMEYTSSTDNDDGDMYFIDDYETVDALFADMLEETKR